MMRVVLIPLYICNTLKVRIIEALGSRGLKVGYDRLTTPFSENGYGLIDIPSMNLYMLRTWLPYLKESPIDHFSILINDWSIHYKKKYRKSALLSEKRVIITEELPSLDAAWFDYTLVGIDPCTSEGEELFVLRSTKRVTFDGKTFNFDLKESF